VLDASSSFHSPSPHICAVVVYLLLQALQTNVINESPLLSTSTIFFGCFVFLPKPYETYGLAWISVMGASSSSLCSSSCSTSCNSYPVSESSVSLRWLRILPRNPSVPPQTFRNNLFPRRSLSVIVPVPVLILSCPTNCKIPLQPSPKDRV